MSVGACGIQQDPPFTLLELDLATKSFNPKKAPGLDGFTADICSHAITSDPELFLIIANSCLQLHHFPKIWKEATVIALPKPGKDNYAHPKSYRPIGLLPVLGKILEKMIMARLRHHLHPRISANQYGFMPQRSCEDALYTLIQHIRSKLQEKMIVTLVSLDIEGAFDSAWWPAIRMRLVEEKCPEGLRRLINSYLEDRRVRVRYAGREHCKGTSKGCVQGSIGGPILWNLLLDTLLKELKEKGVYSQAFADDVVLVFHGGTASEIERQANAALDHAQRWGDVHKLKFAAAKTNALVVTNKLKHDTPRLSMGGTDITLKKEIKILGLIVDNKLTFNAHVDSTCKKVVSIYKQLIRAAGTSWGLHPEIIHQIYISVIEPITLYAASAWEPAVRKLGVQKRLNFIQRSFAQKICKAYRTVSLHSALILAGILPLDIRVREAATLYRVKRGDPIPDMAGREIERLASVLESPHPAEHIRLEFLSLTTGDQVQETLKDSVVQIYTDGSKIEGKVGAALSIWSGGAEIRALKLTLPTFCTVYQAELLAICKATELALGHKEVSFGIYSDSMAALQTVTNPNCLHPLAVQSRKNITSLSRQNKVAALFWIKAHAGMEGNERADHLAKEAALRLKRAPDYDRCPVSFVKKSIRMDSLDEWNRRYLAGETASVTKLFFPSAVDAYRVIKKFTPTKHITQALTGHGGFSEYLHRFKCKENPACVCDPQQSESLPHVLTECPAFLKHRRSLEDKLNIDITPANLREIMESGSRNSFLEYCEKIVKIVNNRNKVDIVE